MKGEKFMQKIPKPVLKAVVRVSAHKMKREDRKRLKKRPDILVPVQREIRYGDDKGNVLDIYSDESDKKRRPLIIYIHGGSLFYGDKRLQEEFCCELATRGNLVAAVNYRLIPQVTFPEQIGDILDAYSWIDRHQGEIGYDPESVYVTGDCAGALLAVYSAAVNQNQMLADLFRLRGTRLKIKALGLVSGMFYLYQRRMFGRMYPLLFGENYREVPYLSYIRPRRLLEACTIPPCYLVTSEEDPLKEFTKAFNTELEKHGVPHQMHCWAKGERGILERRFCVIHPQWEESRQTIDEMMEYFRKCSRKEEQITAEF